MDRRRWVLPGLVLALVVAGVAVQWWRTHPAPVFHAAGAGMKPDHAAPGQAFNTQVFRARTGVVTVRITGAEPRFVEDSTDAEVDLLVCTPAPGTTADIGYAMPDDHVASVCETLEPAVGHEITFGDDAHRELLIRVEPQRPGTLRLRGMDVSYDLGWRRAEQPVGDVLVLKTR